MWNVYKMDYIDSSKCQLYGSNLNKILIFNKPLKIEEEERKREEKLNRTTNNIEINPIIYPDG